MVYIDWELIIIIALVCLTAAVCVYFIYKGEINRKLVGTLRVETSDDDGPYMFLELKYPVNEVISKEFVYLRVSTESLVQKKQGL